MAKVNAIDFSILARNEEAEQERWFTVVFAKSGVDILVTDENDNEVETIECGNLVNVINSYEAIGYDIYYGDKLMIHD